MIRAFTCICLALLCMSVTAFARPSDDKSDLKARFKARDAALQLAEHAGFVGETVEGYVEVVDHAKPDESVLKTLKEENADRKTLYSFLSENLTREAQKKNTGEKITPEMVARHNAERNFRRTKPNDFLRVEDKIWIQKKDEDRYFDLVKLKADGTVGETSEGLVEAVTPGASKDSRIRSLVTAENKSRRDMYQRFAELDKSDSATVAKQYGEIHFENAQIGDMLKDASGWHKKS
ncbi:MAG TPA: DUF1318 domain-containing protein [Phycisphaerales bacterium]|nr:DUF1318 domain-containing protein [Phycisphaerales bacterium]